MLKALKSNTFAGIANAKCGEVYFQSLNSYRIDCAFCDMKSFVFADFLLHIQNEHFEHELLKTEAVQPKQEQPDESPQIHNPFSWYEVANEEDSENEFIAEPKEQREQDEVEDPVDVSSSAIAIMKWSNGSRERRALKIDYHEESDSTEGETGKAKKQQLICMHCQKSYQSSKMLQRHMERQHKCMDSDVEMQRSNEHKCEHCDKVYQGKYTLRQHVKRDHDISLGETFLCLECNAQLPRLRLLDEHVVQAHGGAPCMICGRRYKTRHELKRHQLKHTSERNVNCSHPGCEKRFFTTRHMRNHSKVHSAQKNFVCESCGYSCRNKETLRVHLRSHSGERPFSCKVCDRCFSSHSGVREHMAMHSTERPHICNVCGATFSRQKGLYHHKFLHAATKQFVCKLCGNAYAQAAGLAGHMRKHRNDEFNV